MAALGVTAAIIVLASGCGGSSSGGSDASSSSSPGTSNVVKEVAYSNCMHAHGVDVTVGSNGNVSIGSSGQGGSPQAVQAAQNACMHLLPNGGQAPKAKQQQALQRALKYSQCMRSHGVPDFPDPTSNGNGPVGFTIPNGSGIDTNSATYMKANQACQSLMLPGGGS
jgi:hypothetical protein